MSLDAFVAIGAQAGLGQGNPVLGFPGGEQVEPDYPMRPDIASGSDGLSADGEKVGEVAEFEVAADTGRPQRLVVKQGWLFTSEREVPVDWITSLSDKGVMLSASKLDVQALARQNERAGQSSIRMVPRRWPQTEPGSRSQRSRVCETVEGIGREMAEASVLVVDDEPPVLRLLAWVMSSEGWGVHTAGDAESALEQLSSLKPDVALVDIRLPGMSGLELSKRIKESTGTHVVLMSAYERPKSHTGDAFVAKPFDIHELTRLIAGIVKSHGEG